VGSTAWGQRADESAKTPESAVQLALRNSPEIRKAELAVESAEAQLALVRAQITRDVIAVHAKVSGLRNHKKQLRLRVEMGTTPPHELETVLMSLAEVEAELKYLKGSNTADNEKTTPEMLSTFFSDKTMVTARPPIENGTPVGEILQNPVGLVFESIAWRDMMDFVSETYDLNVNVDATLLDSIVPYVKLANVTLHDAFLALAEQNEEVCFIIRDYGIFVTTRDRATKIPGPTIPANIPFFK
jgi:hypothetical protein